MIVGRLRNGVAGGDRQVLPDKCVAVGIAGPLSGDGGPAAQVVPGERSLNNRHVCGMSSTA